MKVTFRIAIITCLFLVFNSCEKSPIGPICNNEMEVIIGSSTVILSGFVNPNFNSTDVFFEYGPTSSYGSSIQARQSQISGGINVNVSATLTGLQEFTNYHYRMKAVNSQGTSSTRDMTFFSAGELVDIDGNSYKVVLIGKQKWMAENLRTKHFSDGTPIQDGESASDYNSPTPYYYDYNDLNNSSKYGLLYNYYAASKSFEVEPQYSSATPSGIQGVCPTGWHLPSFPEIKVLINSFGGEQLAGGYLKSNLFWKSPNISGPNQSNFNALPAGSYDKGNYNYGPLGEYSFFWSTSTPQNQQDNFFRGLYLHYTTREAPLTFASGKSTGNSIRCLKD